MPLAAGVTAAALLTHVLVFFILIAFLFYRTLASQWLRVRVAAYVERRAKAARRAAREVRLDEACVCSDEHDELIAIVDAVERENPEIARRYDLEPLLDRYVELAIAHHRAAVALRRIDRGRMAFALASIPPHREAHRRALLERRIAEWDRCRERVDTLEDQLVAVTELVRLVGQHVLAPAIELDDTVIADRLELVSALDEAAEELSA